MRGSLFRNAELLVGLAATFVITPFIVHALGARLYGFWTLIGAFIGYYGLMDFGLSSAAARYLSQALGRGSREELNEVANTSFFLFGLIGAVVLLVSIACALACPLFVSDPADAALFREIMLLMGASTAIGFPLRVCTGVLTAYLRYDVIAYLAIGRALAANAAIYLLVRRGGGLLGVAGVSVAASLLLNAATFAACRLKCPDVRLVLFRYDAARARLMFGYSWKTFVSQLGDVLRFRLDSVVIAGGLDVALLTPYSVGVRLVEGLTYLVHSSVGMMLPVFSLYEGRGDHDGIRGALLLSTRLSSLLAAFVGFSVIFYAPAFILRWMGPGFDSGARVAAILAAGFILELSQTPGVQMLYGLSRHGVLAALIACEGALNLALSLFFMRRFGLYGVALGTAVSMILFKLFAQPVYICRVSGLPLRVFLGEVILGTVAKAAAPLGLFFLLIRPFVLPTYARLIACVAAQTLVFAPAAFFLVLNAAERRAILGALRSARAEAPRAVLKTFTPA